MTTNQVINGFDISNLFDLTKPPIPFNDDPKRFIPEYGSMIYTVWDKDEKFIYAGISGLGTKKDPRGRIEQHRSGRRSGDQFCTYIQDFYVLPEILETGTYKPKKKSLDDMTRDYTRNRLFYRFVVIEEIGRSEIISMEDEIRKGVFGFPPPVLNGLPDSW
tara:strand:+ start:239 stop:721 length:483 start_codon:yes stop_codon:yes gene_type:complete